MLKKKVATMITAAIRKCSKCSAHVALAPKGETICPKCGAIVCEGDNIEEK